MRPGVKEIKKIWDWTRKDIEDLFKAFCIPLEKGVLGSGPTNAYAIYLFCMIDLWGSIFLSKFGERNTGQNVSHFLNLLNEKSPDLYRFEEGNLSNLADQLRNNLAHNYGLRVIKSNKIQEWLEINVNNVGPIIFTNDNGRIQIDCIRLKDHVLEIIEEWLKKIIILTNPQKINPRSDVKPPIMI